MSEITRPSGKEHWTKKQPDKVARGEKIATAELSETQVREIQRKWEARESTQTAMAEEYNVSQAQISRICNKKRWSHL